MEYINNIKTGFSVKIDPETGNFEGSMNSSKYRYGPVKISGNINTMEYREKLRLEGILDEALPASKFWDAMDVLLPGFKGFC